MKNFDKSLLNVKLDKQGKVKAFTIDRAYWGIGEEGGSLLDDETGKMCCLGFYSLACGASKKAINTIAWPQDVNSTKKFKKEVDWLTEYLHSSEISALLGAANDATDGKYGQPDAKEARIKELFAKQNIKVSFRGKL